MIRLMLLISLITPSWAVAEIYKCVDENGQIQFSDQPCGDNAEKIAVDPPPLGPEESRKVAEEREQERIERRANRERLENEKINRTIADSNAKIRKMKSENYDPEKCKAARSKMAAMRRRDPIGYSLELNYFEYKSAADLYCGNQSRL